MPSVAAIHDQNRGAIHVRDLNALVRAFAAADRAVKEDLRDALMESAAPVRSDAQAIALHTIKNIQPTRFGRSAWSEMRIGVSSNTIVYIAPVERGVKTKGRLRYARPNLAPLLLEAMETAAEHNVVRVARRFEQLLDEVADVWERAA